jgi:O-antigen/teichoic acid export membrane protein
MASIRKYFFWSGIEQIGPKAISLASSVVLARLLDPSAYGLMGMLAVFLGLAQVFADSGLSASLIQRNQITADDETSVFAMNISAGIVLAVLLCLVSPLVAWFYRQPVLAPMLCVLSLSIVISSFCNVQLALLTRSMAFHKTALVSTLASLAAAGAGIGMAYAGHGVWSLVAYTLTSGIVKASVYWVVSPWRPSGSARFDCIRSMWRFSSKLLYSRLVTILYQNMYLVIIGKVYSPASLGLYNMADALRLLPVTTMTEIVNSVSFPLFSRCQGDKPLLLQRIREIIRSTLLLSAGGLTLLAVMADPLIPLALTEKWRDTVPLFRILACAGILYPVHALYLMALQAQGHSNLFFRLENIKVVLGIVTVALVYRHGVVALAWTEVGLRPVSYILNVWYIVRMLEYKWRMQAFDILPTLLLCAAAGFLSWWMGVVSDPGPVMKLGIQAATFLAVFGTGIYLFRNLFFSDLQKHTVEAFEQLKQKRNT